MNKAPPQQSEEFLRAVENCDRALTKLGLADLIHKKAPARKDTALFDTSQTQEGWKEFQIARSWEKDMKEYDL
jgi:hypothetical protein